jgi:lipoprotein-anchoring transpeptidase ErfK/SrfK
MQKFTRRDFLKFSLFGAGSLLVRPWINWGQMASDWPDAASLGRNCVGGMINMRAKPSVNSEIIAPVYEDSIFVWLREVIGEAPSGLIGRKWVETPDGYIYAPSVQPVKNIPNIPVSSLPVNGGTTGMWAEVTIPYVDLNLENPPGSSEWVKNVSHPRLYYSQVMWIDDILTSSSGQVQYRVNERYGTYGDIFWANAEAFRPVTEEEIAPINPEVEDKMIVVDVSHQTLSCMEEGREVYFCRVSTGAKFDAYGNAVDKWSTPLGAHLIWRKLVSLHMAGGGLDTGWDTPGIAWTSLFVGEGVAIHSTFWHNDFGTPRSHGCVNCTAEDAKFVFRWSVPVVQYEPGDLTVAWPDVSTTVDVVEG